MAARGMATWRKVVLVSAWALALVGEAKADDPSRLPVARVGVATRGGDGALPSGEALGSATIDAGVSPIEEVEIRAVFDLAWDVTGLTPANPYIGVAWRPAWIFGRETTYDAIELGATAPLLEPSPEGDARLWAAAALAGGEGIYRYLPGNMSIVLSARTALQLAEPLYTAVELIAALNIPVTGPRGVSGLMHGTVDFGAVMAPVRFGLRANVGVIVGARDPYFSTIPHISLRVADELEIEAFGVLNIAGTFDSTFVGGPWSVGLGLHFPARGRPRHGQCESDSDCAGGFSCEIVADCDMCQGGPMYCRPQR